MKMKVDLSAPNPSLVSIFDNPNQYITLDANFLIPPDRSSISRHSFTFDQFREIWLEPIFNAFENLAIHEAVLDELVEGSVRNFADEKIKDKSSALELFKDSELSPVEAAIRDSIEAKIYPLTKYDPVIDNKDDRGEVKSLAYIATKGLLYFAAHDNNAIQLVEKSSEWSTGLDNVKAIKMYEIMYYLYTKELAKAKDVRILYKYQYYLTKKEKSENPEWGIFKYKMDSLYKSNSEK
jgi:hypothetical protein